MRDSRLAFTALILALSACTHASTSAIPVEIPGVGLVYRYEGRANFAHQMAEADRVMIEHCRTVNGGKPVIVSLQKRNIGMGGLANTMTTSQVSGAATVTPGGATLFGSGTGYGTGMVSTMANQNQEILYRCAK